MPTYKLNFFFKQRDNGWSETLYKDDFNATRALSNARAVVIERTALLGGILGDGSSPRLNELRVSNVEVQRDSLVYYVPLADGTSRNPLGPADNPNLCVQLRLDSGDLYRRQLYLRGQPDKLIDNNGIYTADAAWTRQFANWVVAVIGHGFGILAVTKPAGVPPLIASIGPVDATGTTVTSTLLHGLVDQDSVRIVSSPGVTGIIGNWRVQVIDATKFKLLGATAVGVYLGGGHFYKRTYAVRIIDNIEIVKAGRRATGRPFDAPRGRRRVRARR